MPNAVSKEDLDGSHGPPAWFTQHTCSTSASSQTTQCRPTTPFPTRASSPLAILFDQWMEEASALPTNLVQHMCATWLAWQQGRVPVSLAQFLERTGLDADTWLFLTQGMLNIEAVAMKIQHQVSCELADPDHSSSMIAHVVAGALGDSSHIPSDVYDRVLNDLEPA